MSRCLSVQTFLGELLLVQWSGTPGYCLPSAQPGERWVGGPPGGRNPVFDLEGRLSKPVEGQPQTFCISNTELSQARWGQPTTTETQYRAVLCCTESWILNIILHFPGQWSVLLSGVFERLQWKESVLLQRNYHSIIPPPFLAPSVELPLIS